MLKRRSSLAPKGRIKRKRASTGRIRATRANKKGKKLPSISKLIKEADAVLSRQVRQIDLPGETLQCYTCGGTFEKKKMHCSHFLSRYYKAARWNRDNVRAACMLCNIYKKGDLVRYRQNLIKEIGEARVLAVEALRDAPLKLTREYLTALIEELKVGTPAPQPLIEE